jgi:2-polyprenyl-6-methoxyphenol hydroxylase-like FAD-dependent oxidoreductase
MTISYFPLTHPTNLSNQAFEDAAVLGSELISAFQSERVTAEAVTTAVKRYEEIRRPRANWVQAYAAALGSACKSGTPSKMAGNKALDRYVKTFPPDGPTPDRKVWGI